MSGYVIEIPQTKETSSIWSQKLKRVLSLIFQALLLRIIGGTDPAVGGNVLHTVYQKESLLAVRGCVCGQCLRTPCEEPAQIPADAERL